MSKEDNELAITNAINELIMRRLKRVEDESCRPGFDPDRSDHFIIVNSGVVRELRRIREEFENIVTTPEYLSP